MNVANVTKRDINEFSHIGLLIIDEAHTICTENLSQSLFWFTPKYTIALSATPERTDGKGKILELYFGPERIERKLWRPFNCYVIRTTFKPPSKQNRQGRLDWSGVLESQALNEDRNNMLVDLIRYFQTRNFLVLCKRVDQGTILYNKLKSYKQDVEIFTGTSKRFNRESRILISTYSKTGVGFDHPKLDALIVASDVEEGIEQYVGRVFRREDVVPIVFDVVDKMHTLYKHFCTRKKLYESIGAQINEFDLSFIEFNKWRQLNN
jgi:superfamily II DNA or RNA helicase